MPEDGEYPCLYSDGTNGYAASKSKEPKKKCSQSTNSDPDKTRSDSAKKNPSISDQDDDLPDFESAIFPKKDEVTKIEVLRHPCDNLVKSSQITNELIDPDLKQENQIKKGLRRSPTISLSKKPTQDSGNQKNSCYGQDLPINSDRYDSNKACCTEEGKVKVKGNSELNFISQEDEKAIPELTREPGIKKIKTSDYGSSSYEESSDQSQDPESIYPLLATLSEVTETLKKGLIRLPEGSEDVINKLDLLLESINQAQSHSSSSGHSSAKGPNSPKGHENNTLHPLIEPYQTTALQENKRQPSPINPATSHAIKKTQSPRGPKPIEVPSLCTSLSYIWERDTQKLFSMKFAGGKWIMLFPRSQIDAQWEIAKSFYNSGRLPNVLEMKVSTAKYKKTSAENQQVLRIKFFVGKPQNDMRSNEEIILTQGMRLVELMRYASPTGKMMFKTDLSFMREEESLGRSLNSSYMIECRKSEIIN